MLMHVSVNVHAPAQVCVNMEAKGQHGYLSELISVLVWGQGLSLKLELIGLPGLDDQ